MPLTTSTSSNSNLRIVGLCKWRQKPKRTKINICWREQGRTLIKQDRESRQYICLLLQKALDLRSIISCHLKVFEWWTGHKSFAKSHFLNSIKSWMLNLYLKVFRCQGRILERRTVRWYLLLQESILWRSTITESTTQLYYITSGRNGQNQSLFYVVWQTDQISGMPAFKTGHLNNALWRYLQKLWSK